MPEASGKPWHEVLASLTPLILGVCVTAVGAAFTQVYNYRQLQLNQLATLDKFREALVSEKPADREFAYASFAALGYEDLALKIITVKKDAAGRGVAQTIEKTGSSEVKAAAAAVLESIPAQIYIQIGAGGEAKASALTAALKEAGLVPLGTENVAGKAVLPKKSEVRYFNQSDKELASKIVDVLRRQGDADAHSVAVTFLTARPGSVEVWLAE